VLGYSATVSTPLVAAIAAWVVIAFAVMDAYYLSLERQYRQLYRRVAADDKVAWQMDIEQPSRKQLMLALRSPVNVILYGSSLSVALAVGVFLLAKERRQSDSRKYVPGCHDGHCRPPPIHVEGNP
jgi:hypothetical protein